VRDLRVSPNGRDLIAGTHGRGVWILDDAVATLERAKAGPITTALFPPATAYQYEFSTPTFNTTTTGDDPDGQVLITFALAHVAKVAPTIDVIDARGRIVRKLAGTMDVDGEQVPVVSNFAGFNRVAWDLTGDKPVPWYRAPKWNQGPDNGADLLPGAYSLRLNVDGVSYTGPLTIAPDPRAVQTPAERARHVAYLSALYAALSRVDTALNEIDNLGLQIPERIRALKDRADASASRPDPLASRAAQIAAEASADGERLSSYPVNGQDNDFLEDRLRERIGSLLGIATTLSPTAEQERESAVVRREVDAALAAHAAFMRDRVAPLQVDLARAGLKPIDLSAKPPEQKKDEKADEHGSRREED
jgi:hypothetical protein